jgi:hypothetical protein
MANEKYIQTTEISFFHLAFRDLNENERIKYLKSIIFWDMTDYMASYPRRWYFS